MKSLNISAFVNSYLATASWVTIEQGECNKFTRDAVKVAKADCEVFIKKVVDKFGETVAESLLTIPGNDLTYLAPHDFFLTRNGHGAGFWDREEVYGKEESAALTKISKEIGSVDCIHTRGPKSKLVFL